MPNAVGRMSGGTAAVTGSLGKSIRIVPASCHGSRDFLV